MPTVMLARNGQGTDEPDMQTTLPHVLPTHQTHRYDIPPSLNDYENPLSSLVFILPLLSLQVVLKGFVDLARRSESKSEQDVFAREGSSHRDPAKQQALIYMGFFYKYFFLHFLVII